MTFVDLIQGADLEYAPQWLRDFWDECQWLKEESDEWQDLNGDYSAMDFVTEFRKQSYGYIKAGIIAHQIRTKRVYAKISQSFTAFCEKWLGRSIWQVNRIIDAAGVAIRLIGMGFTELPATESQCRPLVKLIDFDLENVWSRVCRFIPEKDRTAKNIEAIACRLSDVDPDYQGKAPSKRIELPREQWDLLTEKAARYGMKPKKYLEILLQKDLGDEPTDPLQEPEPKPSKRSKGFGGFSFAGNLPNLLPNIFPNHAQTAEKIRDERQDDSTGTIEAGIDPSFTQPLFPRGCPASPPMDQSR
ncbi:hypothetical protein [Picosynechococcus sp. PCC 8807]|uniref:hypothetical protein n=1 Tax=Picosynechococcus sp. PCC 8807 TaxID=195248 RepID=UPI00081072AA|nr:hypothetical protein [Picosynechococcus sp. PCC 8807]ANV89223.1 hypothetical protein AWQ24_00365 [Picosynechococcus sp. PCC 8807]